MNSHVHSHIDTGFRRKPRLIYWIAACYILIPFTTLQQQGVTSGPLILAAVDLLASLTAALAVLTVTRLGLLYLFTLSIFIIGYKFIELWLGAVHGWWDLLFVLFWFSAPMVFYSTSLSVPYLQPQARWWKRPTRYKCQTEGTMYFDGMKFPVVMMDLSEGGAFICLDKRNFSDKSKIEHPFLSGAEDHEAKQNLHRFPKINEALNIVVRTLPGLDSPYKQGFFEVKAEVVWATKVVDPLQHGLGLRFVGQSWWQKRKLKKYLKLFPDKHS